MNRVELQEKLNTLLLGKPANYNYYIAHDVDKALSEWFDNSQGYYSMRADNYNFAICYVHLATVCLNIKLFHAAKVLLFFEIYKKIAH